jgi:hypothetical protein
LDQFSLPSRANSTSGLVSPCDSHHVGQNLDRFDPGNTAPGRESAEMVHVLLLCSMRLDHEDHDLLDAADLFDATTSKTAGCQAHLQDMQQLPRERSHVQHSRFGRGSMSAEQKPSCIALFRSMIRFLSSFSIIIRLSSTRTPLSSWVIGSILSLFTSELNLSMNSSRFFFREIEQTPDRLDEIDSVAHEPALVEPVIKSWK